MRLQVKAVCRLRQAQQIDYLPGIFTRLQPYRQDHEIHFVFQGGRLESVFRFDNQLVTALEYFGGIAADIADPLTAHTVIKLLKTLTESPDIHVIDPDIRFRQFLLDQMGQFRRIHAAYTGAVLVPHAFITGTDTADKSHLLGDKGVISRTNDNIASCGAGG